MSYGDRRTHFVRYGAFKSAPTLVLCGVPQGSVLGPILFSLYTADHVQLIQRYDFCPHLYADDTHIGPTWFMSSAGSSHSSREDICVYGRRRVVDARMRSNRLQLNTAKTELQSIKDLPSRQRLQSWSSDVSRPVITAVCCRRPCLSSRCRTTLERSNPGRCIIDLSASFQVTAQD